MRRLASAPWLLATVLLVGIGLLPSFAPEAEAARRRKAPSTEELINPLLSPELALWLVGPISRLAKADEIEAYGKLTDDGAAREFIDEFWRRRDPDPRFAANPLRETFTQRAEEADRLFSEAGARGRGTDRGTIYVLYGPPSEEEFEISEHPDDPPILLWRYDRDTAKGLDGKKPDRFYRFIKRDQKTRFYTPNRRPARPRIGPP